jgi:hypothetical protein
MGYDGHNEKCYKNVDACLQCPHLTFGTDLDTVLSCKSGNQSGLLLELHELN